MQPQTPATQQGQTTSKTLFVGNLSYNVERADVYVHSIGYMIDCLDVVLIKVFMQRKFL